MRMQTPHVSIGGELEVQLLSWQISITSKPTWGLQLLEDYPKVGVPRQTTFWCLVIRLLFISQQASFEVLKSKSFCESFQGDFDVGGFDLSWSFHVKAQQCFLTSWPAAFDSQDVSEFLIAQLKDGGKIWENHRWDPWSNPIAHARSKWGFHHPGGTSWESTSQGIPGSTVVQ